MDCPRCGFNQPDDKYCANCGLDVETYLARPKPIWKRILQDPNFYAILFGGILISAALYIFTNQRTVGRQVGKLFRNTFLLSKDAAGPEQARSTPEPEPPPPAPAPDVKPPIPSAAVTPVAKEVTPSYSQMEVGFFELSRENVSALNGKTLRDEGDWRVMYFEDAKSIESLKAAAGKLPGSQEKPLEENSVEVGAGDMNPDLQLPYLAVGVDWVKNESLHWELDLQMPVPQAARNVADAGAAATDQTPAPLRLMTLEGNVKFKPDGALLLIYDPVNRSPASPDLARLSQSPLHVFTSDDFRMGYSDLIVWVRLK